MQDSMMMADVGDIENVSGSRMATPLAPPSPGSTPISTPSRMPTSMNTRFFQVSATANPCIRLLTSSSTGDLSQAALRQRTSITDELLERSLGQRHQEPDLEQQENRDRDAERGGG